MVLFTKTARSPNTRCRKALDPRRDPGRTEEAAPASSDTAPCGDRARFELDHTRETPRVPAGMLLYRGGRFEVLVAAAAAAPQREPGAE